MSDARRRLLEMIADMKTAMLTTRRGNGQLVSRPMATQDRSPGADLWFVTYDGADKLVEIERDRNVNLTYYKDRTREWVSISGKAKISRNRSKIRELYKSDWRAWFGDDGTAEAGTADDPRMVLIAVTITSAVFMEQDKPAPVVAFELVRGIITRRPPAVGRMRTIGVRGTPAAKSKKNR